MGLFGNKNNKTSESEQRRYVGQDFFLEVEEKYAVGGSNTAVRGVVERGMCLVGEWAYLQRMGETMEVRISGVAKGRETYNAAYAGEEVTLMLKGVKMSQVEVGDRVTG